MRLSLLVISQGRAAGDAIPITLSQFVIGRDKQCHLRPISPLVSKRHCALLIENDKALVRDLNSTNGTYLNNEKVDGERELQDGDHLKIGPLAFQVTVEAQAGVNEPTPPPGQSFEDLDGDDAIAALLLEGGDEASALADTSGDQSIPDDTTMMEMQMLPDGSEEKEKEEAKEKKSEEEDANTSSAAAAILSQYARRQRT